MKNETRKFWYVLFVFFGLFGWVLALLKPVKVDVLSPSMTYNYVKSVVWYHSRGKLKELEGIILNDDLSDQKAIKRKIKNMLKHRTSVYIREFNTLSAPIENVGNKYEELFAFQLFLNDVYEVVFSSKDPHLKLSLTADIMESYQTKANNELLEFMNNKEARL